MNGIERRSGIDRRKKTTPLFCKYWLKGKRALPRRQADRKFPQVVDRYNTKLLAVILLILSLSIFQVNPLFESLLCQQFGAIFECPGLV